tara:strand:- start:5278 stop:5901 length:624 start_codon:yes stop_codon:yes gene_type:complete
MSAPLSIKWDDDVEDSKVPIEIPIKPQNGLLKIIALLIIVGGILVFSIGALAFMPQEVPPDFYEDQANAMNAAGQNVTVEEVQQFFEATEKYADTQRVIEVFAGIGLIAGGAMLFFANSRGIYVGAIGGSLVIIDAIIITVGLSAVETESLVLVASGYMLQGLMSTCGIFCTVLPLLPLFFSGLKAALNNQSGLNVKTRIPDNSSEE